jgi:hypothetical protein
MVIFRAQSGAKLTLLKFPIEFRDGTHCAFLLKHDLVCIGFIVASVTDGATNSSFFCGAM